jgi:hypothetical protein
VFEEAKEVPEEVQPPPFPSIAQDLLVDPNDLRLKKFVWVPKEIRFKMKHFPSSQDIAMGKHSKLLPEASLLKMLTRFHIERQKNFVMSKNKIVAGEVMRLDDASFNRHALDDGSVYFSALTSSPI